MMSTTPVRFRYRDAVTELTASAHCPSKWTRAGRSSSIHVSPRLDFVPLLPPDAARRRTIAHAACSTIMLRTPEFEIRFLLESRATSSCSTIAACCTGAPASIRRKGLRHLQGCYIDIDGPRSLYRVLEA